MTNTTDNKNRNNSDKSKLYSAPRWNDTSLPEIIGYTEPDPKEYEKDHEEFIEYLKKIGRKL